MAKVLRYPHERTKKILKLLVSIAQGQKFLGLCVSCFRSVFHLYMRMQNILFCVVDKQQQSQGLLL